MYVVYALADPRNHQVRYVGMTSDIYERFIQHIRCLGDNEQKNQWIHELKALGFVPLVYTLETMNTIKRAQERERYWINHYVYLGTPLTNDLLISRVKRIRENVRVRDLVEASPDKLNAVIALFAKGCNQRQVLELLWNVYPSNGVQYRKAKAEYESCLTLLPELDTDPESVVSRVVDLLRAGQGKLEIMRIVWGVSPGASTAYKQAGSEYQQVMQSIAKSLGVQA